MVGRFNDAELGNMEARGYANIAPPVDYRTPPATATLDSLVLQMRLTYSYGNTDSTKQRIQVFEVLDTIKSTVGFYSNSSVAISPVALGEVTFGVNPTIFENSLTDTTKYQIVKVKLQGSIFTDLFSDMIKNPTLMGDVNEFMGKYKGLAFRMPDGGGDKILGINPKFAGSFPAAKDTKLSMYYTDGGAQTKTDFVLYFANSFTFSQTYPAISFTQIITDRSATALSGIEGFKDFIAADHRYYVQSGTGLITKLDLADFYKFSDTVQNIVFNSAEIVVTNTSQKIAPAKLQLRMLDSLNHFRTPYIDSLLDDPLTPGVIDLKVTSIVNPYFAHMPTAWSIPVGPVESSIDVRGDLGVTYSISTDIYEINKIFITEFCQQIYKYRHNPRRVTALGLMPSEQEFQKSVNSVILDQNISLRLYYSKPVVKIR